MDKNKLADSAAKGCVFTGCAFSTAIVLLAGILVCKLIWHAIAG
jgi:hypothetical protein